MAVVLNCIAPCLASHGPVPNYDAKPSQHRMQGMQSHTFSFVHERCAKNNRI